MVYVNHVKAPMESLQLTAMVISFAFVMERSVGITVMVQLSIIGFLQVTSEPCMSHAWIYLEGPVVF